MKLTLAIFLLVGLAIAIPEIEARNPNNPIENGIKNPVKLIKNLEKLRARLEMVVGKDDGKPITPKPDEVTEKPTEKPKPKPDDSSDSSDSSDSDSDFDW